MARTYTDVPEPRYVERAKTAENAEVTPETLIDVFEGGNGINVDLNEANTKVVVSKDTAIIQLLAEQIISEDPLTFSLSDEQCEILDNPNIEIIEVDGTDFNYGTNYFTRGNKENGYQTFTASVSSLDEDLKIYQADIYCLNYDAENKEAVFSTLHVVNDADLAGKLDATKTAVSNVGGLVIPTATLTESELAGIDVGGEQIRVQLGDVFVLDGSTSPYTLDLNTYDGTVE